MGVVALRTSSNKMSWCRALTHVSARVEDIMLEEGRELKHNEGAVMWTVDTIDVVLFDYIDEAIGWRLPDYQVRIARKKVEIAQGGRCAGSSKKKQFQLDHVNEILRDWRLLNLQGLCAECHGEVITIPFSLCLLCAVLPGRHRRRSVAMSPFAFSWTLEVELIVARFPSPSN